MGEPCARDNPLFDPSSTNRVFKKWGAILDVDNTLATALIDGLMHHGEAIVIDGDSYRMKDKDGDLNPTR